MFTIVFENNHFSIRSRSDDLTVTYDVRLAIDATPKQVLAAMKAAESVGGHKYPVSDETIKHMDALQINASLVRNVLTLSAPRGLCVQQELYSSLKYAAAWPTFDGCMFHYSYERNASGILLHAAQTLLDVEEHYRKRGLGIA